MELFGWIVVGSLVAGLAIGVVLMQRPSPWDEIGGGGIAEEQAPDGLQPSRIDDEAELRALIAQKRAARLARGQQTAGDAQRANAAPWSHLHPEAVEEARHLVARRRARLEREGQVPPDEQGELERLLGPPQL